MELEKEEAGRGLGRGREGLKESGKIRKMKEQEGRERESMGKRKIVQQGET